MGAHLPKWIALDLDLCKQWSFANPGLCAPYCKDAPQASGRIDLEMAGFTVNLSLSYLHEAVGGSKRYIGGGARYKPDGQSLIPRAQVKVAGQNQFHKVVF